MDVDDAESSSQPKFPMLEQTIMASKCMDLTNIGCLFMCPPRRLEESSSSTDRDRVKSLPFLNAFDDTPEHPAFPLFPRQEDFTGRLLGLDVSMRLPHIFCLEHSIDMWLEANTFDVFKRDL